MPVTKRAPAVPRKAGAQKARVNSVSTEIDLVSVRMTALNYARSLWTGGEPGVNGEDGRPVTTATKIVTQAKRFERYILGTDAGDDA